jgi:lipoprotein-anchoring transpeptidase ErfK/SrfK
LLVWRKADNFTAFTNGATTWVNGPQGIQARPNGQRFPWEANPSGLPLVPPAPTVPAIARTGKVIIIGLQAQSLTAYENGAVVLVTPVTTGRPALPTPPGQGSVFYRSSPYEFISPWSQDSPYYYPPSWVNWALEFFGGGYFMHDAPWEPANAFGPGSEYGPYASHGCVHVPTEAMRFLYQWGQLGTKVVVEW